MARQHSDTSRWRRGPTHPPRPMVVDITRLGRRPGAMVTLRETVPSPSRIGAELVAIEPGAPLELDLRVESVSEGVLVTGTVTGPTAGECARCLQAMQGRVEVVLTELFAYPESTTEATTEEGEVGHVVDNTIDLEQSIIDAVGLDLPFSPVCQPDCPGLCAECGAPLAGQPGHHHERIDPRWAKLADMRSDTKTGTKTDTQTDTPRGEP